MHGFIRSKNYSINFFSRYSKAFFPFLIKMCGDKHESLAMYRNFSHLPLTKEISIKFQIFALQGAPWAFFLF